MLGVLAHGGGQFLHRCRRLFQVGRLLFGAARQVAVARSDLAGRQADARRRLLDLADDLGELLHRAVGIVAHHREHAVEITVHARAEVTCGNRAQQRGERGQVVVAHLHHRVERFDHAAEVVLEALRIAAHREVTRCRRGGQLLDLLVDRPQVGLGGGHGRGEHRLLARQGLHVHAEIAHRIALHHLNQALGDRVARRHQLVAVGHHAAVLAREGAGIHAVADLAFVMTLRHFRLRRHYRLQRAAHALHRLQQATHFIVAARRQGGIQLAGRHVAGDAHGLRQRADGQATQQHIDAGAESERGNHADQQGQPQQLPGFGDDHRVRHHHAQREVLRGIADLHRHVQAHVAFGIRLERLKGLALGNLGEHLLGFRAGTRLADLGGIGRRQHHALGRKQFDPAGPHRGQRGQVLLQSRQREIDGKHAEEDAVLHDRCAQRAHQHLLAANGVRVRLADLGQLVAARAHVPVTRAVGQVGVGGHRRLLGLAALPGPVAHEATGRIVRFGIHEVCILAVESVRFPHGALAHPFRVRVQLLANDRGQCGAVRGIAAGALGQHGFHHRIVAGEGRAQIGRHLARFSDGFTGHGLARGIDQAGTGLAVDEESGDAEAEQRDRSSAQHQLVGDAAWATGSGRAGGRHGWFRRQFRTTGTGTAPRRCAIPRAAACQLRIETHAGKARTGLAAAGGPD